MRILQARRMDSPCCGDGIRECQNLVWIFKELLPEQVVWHGNCDDAFFLVESCEVELTVEGEPEVFQQDLEIQGQKVYEGLPVADFDVGLPDGALVWHQDGGNMTFDLAQDEALQGGSTSKWGAG